MFPTLLRQASPRSISPISEAVIDVVRNPYKAKKSWPPDFEKLSPKHQFRLERRYKRRAKLKWARPTWTKAVKLTQGVGIAFVLVYGLLYMDREKEDQPFQPLRNWVREKSDSIWTTNTPQPRASHSRAEPLQTSASGSRSS